MSSLNIIEPEVAQGESQPPTTIGTGRRRLPPWLKRPLPQGGEFSFTDQLLAGLNLNTVCEEARCPNRSECWSRHTATFMILGRVCTRPCGFCAVERGKPQAVPVDEPERLAEAVERLGLKHVVITSVTRDDLPDGGADHFYQCILAARARTGATIEVLTPDFQGNHAALDRVLQAKPEVFNHNLETVARLQQRVRRKAAYRVSLDVLGYVKQRWPEAVTKSGLMLGLGETIPELFDALADLRAVGCDLLTLGQYLQPSSDHLPVERFVPPSEFEALGQQARWMGFRHVASAPFVRSSYHADEAWLLASADDRPNLVEANLVEANLVEANLVEANLVEANLVEPAISPRVYQDGHHGS